MATTNRLPALLLPSDTFATRVADPVLQQLEQPWDIGLTVNDAFRPLPKFFDRVLLDPAKQARSRLPSRKTCRPNATTFRCHILRIGIGAFVVPFPSAALSPGRLRRCGRRNRYYRSKPAVRFININVAPFDAYKHGSELPMIADAREKLTELIAQAGDIRVSAEYSSRIAREKAEWNATVDGAFVPSGLGLPRQSKIIGAVQPMREQRDVIVQAAGSLPGALHKLGRVRDVMVGDGSYLRLSSELVTAVAERIKIIVVLIQNHGYASIGHFSATIGSDPFGTLYRRYDAETRNLQKGEPLPVDLAMNACSYGIDVIEVEPVAGAIGALKAALATANASTRATLIHINSDPRLYSPGSEGWWDVPAARASYESQVTAQRSLLGPAL